MWLRCTSSGPSAMRSVRELAYRPAEAKSSRHAGAAVHLDGPVDHLAGHVRRHDLDHRDLLLRRLVAGRVHHPRGLQRQQARLVDLHARLGDALRVDALLGERLAERRCGCSARLHIFSSARSASADQAHAVVDAARARGDPARSRSRGPRRAAGSATGTRTSSKTTSRVAVRRVVVAEHRQRCARRVTPGVSIGTRIIDCWLMAVALSGSVLPMKIGILQRGSPAPEVHHLRPLIT